MASISPGSSLGRYTIRQRLGEGGMATVYESLDPSLQRYVAIKVLPSYHTEDPSFPERFAQEAQAIARLNHPNILQVYDFGEDKGFTYIVSPLVPGGTLQHKLIGEMMSIEDVLWYLGPLADALDFAHTSGILHRDIKPGNVLLTENNEPILADFGLARILEASTRLTQPQQALGTPDYMSPEQVMGKDADHRADLYALGIMLYQMMLGRTPYHADTVAATLLAHVHGELPLPSAIKPDIDPAVEMVLLKALAKEPDDRFQSGAEMVHALEAAAGIATRTAPPPSRAPVPPPPPPTQPATTPAPEAAPVAATPVAEARKGSGIFKWVLGWGVTAAVIVVALGAFFMLQQNGDEVRSPVLAAVESSTSDASHPVSETPNPAASGETPPSDGAPQAAAAAAPAAEVALVADQPSDHCAPPTGDAATGAPANISEALAQLEGMKDRVHTHVANLRGIEKPPHVPTDLRTREQLCDITKGFYRRKEIRDKLFEAEELYKTLGLMTEDQSLEDKVLALQLRQVSTLLDDRTGEVYVLSDAADITPELELSYAMAYTGGLLQALFDVASLSDRTTDTSDRFRAVSALISGDIAMVAGGYPLNETSNATNAQPRNTGQAGPTENIATNIPTIVRKLSLFPRTEGKWFVEDLFFNSNSWDTVNRAYDSPPVSTEQVLHPEKYLANELPVPVSLQGFPTLMNSGWSLTAQDTIGEFLLKSYLEEHLSEEQAAEAAAGWGGDTYILMSNAELGRLLVGLFTFDTVPDAQDFYSAFEDFMAAATEGTNTEVRPADTSMTWVTEGGKSVFLGQKLPSAFIIISDDFEAMVEAGNNLVTVMKSPPAGQSQ